jgi:hypothetical protein
MPMNQPNPDLVGDKLERRDEILKQLQAFKKIPPEAQTLLNKALEQKVNFHTEACCNLKLTAEESQMHKQARALALSLKDFYDKESGRLNKELAEIASFLRQHAQNR